MKVKDLIEHLSGQDQDADVVLAHPAHDYWKNVIGRDIVTLADMELVWSDYHDAWLVSTVEDDVREKRQFVVLSTTYID